MAAFVGNAIVPKAPARTITTSPKQHLATRAARSARRLVEQPLGGDHDRRSGVAIRTTKPIATGQFSYSGHVACKPASKRPQKASGDTLPSKGPNALPMTLASLDLPTSCSEGGAGFRSCSELAMPVLWFSMPAERALRHCRSCERGSFTTLRRSPAAQGKLWETTYRICGQLPTRGSRHRGTIHAEAPLSCELRGAPCLKGVCSNTAGAWCPPHTSRRARLPVHRVSNGRGRITSQRVLVTALC